MSDAVVSESVMSSISVGVQKSIDWREPIFAWLISRVICFAALIAGCALFPLDRVEDLRKARTEANNPNAGPQQDLGQYYREYAQGFRDLKKFGKKPMLFVSTAGREAWAKPFVHWDAVWWLSVAEVGYVADPTLKAEQNVVFYPLFPMLIHGVSWLGIPSIIAAMLIANGAMLWATCLLYRLVQRRSGVSAARWTLALWLAFPASFFSAIPYSEGLMALFAVWIMQSVLDQKSVAAGLFCGLASAIKNQGVIFAGALVVPLLLGPRRFRALVGLACSALGLMAYMLYLKGQYGDPLLFVEIQKQWRPNLGVNNPYMWVRSLVVSTLHSSLSIVDSLIPVFAQRVPRFQFYSGRLLDPWLGWWVLVWFPKVFKLHQGLFLSSVVMLILPLSTGTVASLGRYVWVILPVFVVMGESLYKSHWRWPILISSSLGLLWQAFLFGGGWEVI